MKKRQDRPYTNVSKRCGTCSLNATYDSATETWSCPRYGDEHKKKLRWSGRVTLPPDPATGKRRQSRKTFDSYTATKKWVDQFSVDKTNDDVVAPSQVTLANFITREWFPHIETAKLPGRGRPRKAKTVQGYQDLMSFYVLNHETPLRSSRA